MADLVLRPPDQLGFVTDDLEQSAETIGRLWNVDLWFVHDYNQRVLRFTTYRGEPGTFSSRNAVASPDASVGIVEPVSGPSVHLDVLQRRGPGLAYATWRVDDLTGVGTHMAAVGSDEVMRGGGHGLDGDGEFVYYDTFDLLGFYSQYVVAPSRRRPPVDVLDRH